jgi:hypothetical protein
MDFEYNEIPPFKVKHVVKPGALKPMRTIGLKEESQATESPDLQNIKATN